MNIEYKEKQFIDIEVGGVYLFRTKKDKLFFTGLVATDINGKLYLVDLDEDCVYDDCKSYEPIREIECKIVEY